MVAWSGKDIIFIAQYSVPRDVKTTARYIQYQDEDLIQGADALDKRPLNSPIKPKAFSANP